jgi:hypothetical protein
MNQPKKPRALERFLRMKPLCDGVRTSSEIAEMLDENVKYIQKMMLLYDLPRRIPSKVPHERNRFYVCGRHINKDGYADVICPAEFLDMANKNGRVLEHRLVMARKMGRNLHSHEVVDHIDGIKLHNDPNNLRLFSSNAEHLKATISNKTPNWSKEGFESFSLPRRQSEGRQLVNKHLLKVKQGDARLIEILRALLLFGKDSPYLLGSSHHLEKAGISDFSHSNLQRALDDLYLKYA